MQFTLDGNFQELTRLAEEIAVFCKANTLAEEVEFDLNLAMEELFTNAVRHGGCAGMKDAVRIRLERNGDAVEAVFFDRGGEFDPTSAAPMEPADLLTRPRIGGLGLYLVHQIMRDLTYQREGDWNCTTMKRPL